MSDRYKTALCEGWIDEGPPGWEAGRTVTREDTCRLDAEHVWSLTILPGCSGEHDLFARSATGRKTKAQWASLRRSIKAGGVRNPPMVEVGPTGAACLYEGNHRLRIAAALGIGAPVTIQYLGNVQRRGLVFDPDTGAFRMPGAR